MATLFILSFIAVTFRLKFNTKIALNLPSHTIPVHKRAIHLKTQIWSGPKKEMRISCHNERKTEKGKKLKGKKGYLFVLSKSPIHFTILINSSCSHWNATDLKIYWMKGFERFYIIDTFRIFRCQLVCLSTRSENNHHLSIALFIYAHNSVLAFFPHFHF